MNKKGKELIRSKCDLAMFIYAGIEVFLFGGITYGWPNLVRILKKQNYFHELCSMPPMDLYENTSGNTSHMQMGKESSCSNQDDMFGLVYNIASVITGLGTIVIGIAVDKLPAIATRITFVTLFLTGSLCIAASSPETGTLLIPGMLFIRIGGFLMYFGNMKLANYAPKVKATIITVYAGMFDSSSSMLYIIFVASHAGFSVHSSFYTYSVAVCIPLITTFLFFNMKSIDVDRQFQHFPATVITLPENEKSESLSPKHPSPRTDEQLLHGTDNTRQLKSSKEATSTEESVTNSALSRSARIRAFLNKHNATHLLDKRFYLFLFILSILTLRKEFFVISYNAALVKSANGDESLIEHYSSVFGIAQFFAILVTPVGGAIIDYSRSKGSLKAYVWQFTFTLFLGMLLCICSFINPVEIYYASNIIYVVCRALTYSIAASYISDTYPMKMFAIIVGTTESVGYLLSFLQYPLLTWSNGPLQQDYRVANGIILALCLLALAQPINLYIHYSKLEMAEKNKEVTLNSDGTNEAVLSSPDEARNMQDITISVA